MKKYFICLIILLMTTPVFANDYGLKVGSQAPQIETKDIFKTDFNLEELYADGPVVLVFYRGGWCPYCNLQLQSLQNSVVPVAEEQDATVVAISTDIVSEGITTSVDNKLEMTLISDSSAEIIKDYNLAYKVPEELVSKYKNEYDIDLEAASGEEHHIIAIPAVFIIDQEGIVIYSYANEDYKVRASEEEIISYLEMI